MYGKILKFLKDNATWIVALLGFTILVVVSVRSCQRNMDVDIDATRNRVTVTYGDCQHTRPRDGISKRGK